MNEYEQKWDYEVQQRQEGLRVSLNGKDLEKVKFFWYLEMDLTAVGTMGFDVIIKVGKVAKNFNLLIQDCMEGDINVRAKDKVVPAVLYGGKS